MGALLGLLTSPISCENETIILYDRILYNLAYKIFENMSRIGWGLELKFENDNFQVFLSSETQLEIIMKLSGKVGNFVLVI